MGGRQVAQSIMGATTGRMSAHTAHALKWDWATNPSKLDLSLPAHKFGNLPVVPVPTPGKTPLT